MFNNTWLMYAFILTGFLLSQDVNREGFPYWLDVTTTILATVLLIWGMLGLILGDDRDAREG